MEHKQIEATVTAIDEDQGIVEAIWAVMGNVDEVGDIIHPGAFTKTFSERAHAIKLLDNHRTDSVMSALGTVLELREMSKGELPQGLAKNKDVTGGAWGKFQFLMDTPEGKGAFTRIKRGAVKEWSFGYDAVDKDYSNKDGKTVRNLRGIKLYEVSPVLFPANDATTTTSAKGKPDDSPEDTLEEKAQWTTAYINNLPDSAFLHVESGGDKDEDGKTTPRSLRHLPYRNAEGAVDLPHLRNALSRLGQSDTGDTGGESWLTEDLRKRLVAKAQKLLEQNSKSLDFVSRLRFERVEQELWDERYKIDTVLSEVIYDTLEDKEMNANDKRDLMINSIAQYGQAMLQWFDRILAAGEMEDMHKSSKAGRVLSTRNAKRVMDAMNLLHEALREAGLMGSDDDENDDTGPQKSNGTPTSTAQEAGPPEDDSTRYLKLIQFEIEEMEVINSGL